ncbi:MAG TPA: hypothetical protein VFH03_05795 [Actinoplanes sp.]|nr:hypothetical protein [Actinoplanes sp.]
METPAGAVVGRRMVLSLLGLGAVAVGGAGLLGGCGDQVSTRPMAWV